MSDELVVSDIVKPRCLTSGCHDRLTTAGSLDLETHDVPGRLLGADSQCEDKVLLDTETPFAGYLFEKLDEKPTCGAQMPPLGAPLTEQEKACMHRWLGRPWAEAAAATAQEAP